MSDSHSFPSSEEGLCLHLRLCELDPHATAEVCRAFIGPLLDWLQGRFRNADPHQQETAVHETIFSYVRQPQQYDPSQMDLAAFLRMSARRDLLNLLRREQRHHQGRVPWNDVELAALGGNISGSDEGPLELLERQEQAAVARALLQRVEEKLTEPERRAFRLLLDGERRTPAFAAALGLGDLLPKEQEREVKRFKDRIKVRLKRGGDSHG
jgi:RNA polymerase sigma-70 factor (ECF subfamily)